MDRSIKYYMVKEPIVIKHSESLIQVIELFESTKVSHVIVVDASDEVIGIISNSDLLHIMKYISHQTSGDTYTKKYLKGTAASTIMTENPICLKPDDAIVYATELFLQKEFHALPVVDSGEPVGIMTAYDIMKAYYQENG